MRGRPGRSRRSAPRAVLALTLALAALPAAGAGQDRMAVDGADFDWALRGLHGAVFSLERYRGRPLVLNVWATWCAPCVAELASLERLADSMEGSGVAFLIVSPEPAERVRAFLRRHGYRLPAAVEDQRMPPGWGLEALPTTWVVDGSGRVALKHRGAADWDRDEVRALLLRLARAPGAPPARAEVSRDTGSAHR